MRNHADVASFSGGLIMPRQRRGVVLVTNGTYSTCWEVTTARLPSREPRFHCILGPRRTIQTVPPNLTGAV